MTGSRLFMPRLFAWGDFRSHSGKPLEWKIDCDALTYDDFETLSVLITRRVGAFSRVEGVPRGGLLLANILRHYTTPDGPLLIVDDVCTTGGSLESQRAGRDAIGYVLFSRGGLPWWARALFTLDAHGPSQETESAEVTAGMVRSVPAE